MIVATDEEEEYFETGRHREPQLVESGTNDSKEWASEGELNGQPAPVGKTEIPP